MEISAATEDSSTPPAAWEAAKENIQPLRRGRNIASLTEALTIDPELLEETKREFEEALRAYDGDDPLETWDCYLTWLEEHYPSGLHGRHLPQLLENCISTFITDPDHRYSNDPRFVRVWLKFAGLQVHPEEVYKCMLARGIGVGSAALYVEWANFHELSGEPRRAQEILEKGIQMLAQPQDLVRAALKQLILRLSQGSTRPQQDNSDESPDNGRADLFEQRQRRTNEPSALRNALSRLRTESGQRRAPVIRVGANRLAHTPGAIPQAPPASHSGASTSSCRGNHAKMAVFVDENNPSSSGTSLFAGINTMTGTSSRAHAVDAEKENVRKAGKWTREKIAQRVCVREVPAFEVVTDDLPEIAVNSNDGDNSSSGMVTPAKSRPSVFLGSVLSARKDTTTHMSLSHILGEADTPNINEKRMYDFLAVYAGTSEFQFEEIRLARYRRQKKISLSSSSRIVEGTVPEAPVARGTHKDDEMRECENVSLAQTHSNRSPILQEVVTPFNHLGFGITTTSPVTHYDNNEVLAVPLTDVPTEEEIGCKAPDCTALDHKLDKVSSGAGAEGSRLVNTTLASGIPVTFENSSSPCNTPVTSSFSTRCDNTAVAEYVEPEEAPDASAAVAAHFTESSID